MIKKKFNILQIASFFSVKLIFLNHVKRKKLINNVIRKKNGLLTLTLMSNNRNKF